MDREAVVEDHGPVRLAGREELIDTGLIGAEFETAVVMPQNRRRPGRAMRGFLQGGQHRWVVGDEHAAFRSRRSHISPRCRRLSSMYSG